MAPIEVPFVESDLDGPAARQYADGNEQTQAPDLAGGKTQPPSRPSQKEMELQQAEGKTESVPPEVHSGNVEQDRIDAVNIGPQQRFSFLDLRIPAAPDGL